MARCEVIGDCTLYLGDCRAIVPAIEAVDMIMTDPPYGHNNNNNGDLAQRREVALGIGSMREGRPILNDGPEANALVRWLFQEAARLLPPGGLLCCGGGGGPDPQFAHWSLWLDELLGFKQAVVWDKMTMGLGWHYRRSYEMVLVGEKPGGPCKWYGGNAVRNVLRLQSAIPLATDHPTPKPVALYQHFMRLHALPGDVVLDPFMGAGTGGVAALALGQKFIGIELDERWFDLACRRIEAAYRQIPLFPAFPPAPFKAAQQTDLCFQETTL